MKAVKFLGISNLGTSVGDVQHPPHLTRALYPSLCTQEVGYTPSYNNTHILGVKEGDTWLTSMS